LTHDLFIATVSEESHRAFVLNSQLFSILRHEDQEKALPSKQGTPSADTVYLSPLSLILALVRAGRSTFAFIIPPQYSLLLLVVQFVQITCLAHFTLVAGEFTGLEGFQKLKHWLASHF
jgi:hypothetical protein